MNDHSCVASWEPLDNEDDYLYRITRTQGMPDVHVHLTDAYQYSRAEYLARPAEVMRRNSFIILGLPHAYPAGLNLTDEARRDGVGIGKIGKFMGALNSRDVSTYEALEERREREIGRR